jgi:hypothetical protein
MLGIKTLLYFSPETFPDIDKHFECHHIPLKEKDRPLIDFDPLSTQVQELIKDKNKSPVMIFCVSGQVSGALAIKMTMDTNKTFNKELASAYVMTKRYELKDIQPWLF